MWESLETQRPSAWRVVFKGLTLLEHLIKNGSERCVDDARNHSHTLRGLHRFNYYEGTIDRGVGVREKSKQIVEVLGDDERIREERQKARKMREKFGTSSGGSMAGVSGGGGGSSKYAGYGNDDSQWSGGRGGGGGYGDSGIGSRSGGGGGGGYGDDGRSSKYGGRYADGGVDSSSSRGADAPTFASLPPEGGDRIKKKKKKKKKAKAEAEDAAPEAAPAPGKFAMGTTQTCRRHIMHMCMLRGLPLTFFFCIFLNTAAEVDLFDLGAPDSAPAPAPAAADDSFDAFQTAGPTSDAFGDADPFAAAPATAPAPAAPVAQTFDAFGNGSAQPQQGNVNAVSDAFGSMNMGGGQQQQQQPMGQPQVNGTAGGDDDDDFGDFGGAGASSSGMPTAAAVAESKAKDPLSGLINLDGLQKNPKMTNNLNRPVVSGDAASQYMQYQQQMAAQGNAQNVGAQVSFNGIDGLNKMPTDFSPKGIRQNNRQPGQPIMVVDQQGMNGQDGGASMGGSDAISSMFAPAPQGQQQQQGGQMMMGMGGGNQQGGMMNQGQMNNMGMQQGMQQGMQGGMQGGMNVQQQGMYNQQMAMQGQGQQQMGGGGMGMGGGNPMYNQQMAMQGQGQQMGQQMGGNMMGGMGMGSQFQ